MLANCVSRQFSDLADHQQGRHRRTTGSYDITVGLAYNVAGMGIWENVLHFLVRNDQGIPEFIPAGLFDCPSQPLPGSWRFALRPGIAAEGSELWESPCAAIWGYEELVSDPIHAEALGERSRAALGAFERSLGGDSGVGPY